MADPVVMGKNQFRGVLFKYGPKPVQVCCFIFSFGIFLIITIGSWIGFKI